MTLRPRFSRLAPNWRLVAALVLSAAPAPTVNAQCSPWNGTRSATALNPNPQNLVIASSASRCQCHCSESVYYYYYYYYYYYSTSITALVSRQIVPVGGPSGSAATGTAVAQLPHKFPVLLAAKAEW